MRKPQQLTDLMTATTPSDFLEPVNGKGGNFGLENKLTETNFKTFGTYSPNAESQNSQNASWELF